MSVSRLSWGKQSKARHDSHDAKFALPKYALSQLKMLELDVERYQYVFLSFLIVVPCISATILNNLSSGLWYLNRKARYAHSEANLRRAQWSTFNRRHESLLDHGFKKGLEKLSGKERQCHHKLAMLFTKYGWCHGTLACTKLSKLISSLISWK